MRAIVHDRYGPPDVLRIEEAPDPAPLPDEVLVRVRSAALTRADCATRGANRNGGLPAMTISRLVFGIRAPRRRVLGSEYAGIVEQAGADVTRFKPGDRVFGTTGFRFGAHAELLTAKESARIALMPAGATFDQAAAITDGGLNALWCLRRGRVRKGDDVLVYGASGAIGTAGVQLARHLGANVTGVTTAQNAELVRDLGAQAVVDYRREDFTKNGERYDVIFDAVGKLRFSRCRASLKPGGRYLATDGFGNFIRSRYSRQVVFDLPPRYTREDVEMLKHLVETGDFKPVVDRTYPMDEVVDAARYVETEQKVGNVILRISA